MNGQPMTPPAGGPAPEQDRAGPNPVVDAIQTIAKFIAAQQEQGNPIATKLQSWLQQGITLMTSQGQGEAPAPAEEAPEAPPAKAGGPRAATQDMNAGKNVTMLM